MGDTHSRSNLIFISQAGETGGLCYGEIYQHQTATPINITATNTSASVVFRDNGASRNTTPDADNNRIVITHAGTYLCMVSAAIKSTAGGAQITEFHVSINSTDLHNLHVHRLLSGGGTDLGAISMSGLITVNVGDSIGMTCQNDSVNQDLIVEDANLTIIQVGGD